MRARQFNRGHDGLSLLHFQMAKNGIVDRTREIYVLIGPYLFLWSDYLYDTSEAERRIHFGKKYGVAFLPTIQFVR